jgi:hypothetical protein
MGTVYSVTGTFGTADAAFAIGERVREIADEQATIRLLLPGKDEGTVEASIESSGEGWHRIAVFGFGVGLLGAYVFDTILGASWTVGIVGLATGVLTGGLLGMWLSGESVSIRRSQREERGRVADALRAGHSVVTVSVRTHRDAERVRELIEDADGYIETAEQPARNPIEESALLH